MKIGKIKIPLIGLLSLLATCYYLKEPSLKIAEGEPRSFPPQPNAFFGDSIAIMYSFVVPVTNTSIKSGFVDRVEVTPNGIQFLPYTVRTIEVDRNWVPLNKTRFIKVQVTVTYPKEHSSFYSPDPNVKYFPALRFQLYDNHGHPVLEANEKSTWFYVMTTREHI